MRHYVSWLSVHPILVNVISHEFFEFGKNCLDFKGQGWCSGINMLIMLKEKKKNSTNVWWDKNMKWWHFVAKGSKVKSQSREVVAIFHVWPTYWIGDTNLGFPPWNCGYLRVCLCCVTFQNVWPCSQLSSSPTSILAKNARNAFN